MRVCSLVLGLLLVAQPVGQGASADPISQAPAPPSKASHAAALRAKALELGYNLDHEQALETFKESIAADPDDPAGYRLAAATIWITLLFEQGVITVEDYLGQARADVARATPRPELAAQFHDYLQRARTLGERRLREHPGDADAHFQVGAAFGFDASYTATVEGRVLASDGYAATPLTGVWANFPYLHNGSVPTLHHLLGPVSERPRIFEVMAARRLDRTRVGQLLYANPAAAGRGEPELVERFGGDRNWFNIARPGCGNGGHDLWPRIRTDANRRALIEYLKTL